MPNCPRCNLSLQPEKYEDQDVFFCGTCWGHWLDHETFARIMESEVYSFSKDESVAVLSSWANRDPGEISLSQSAACPVCGDAMEQSPIDVDRCPVVIDRCAEHGVWLDTSEIKQIQVFYENRDKT